MPKTRAMLSREELEGATLEQMQKEARRLQLPVVADRGALLETILTHQERQGHLNPLSEASTVTTLTGITGTVSAEYVPDVEYVTAGTFREALSEISASLLKQQQQMMLQQQEFITQMVQQASERSHGESTAGAQPASDPERYETLAGGTSGSSAPVTSPQLERPAVSLSEVMAAQVNVPSLGYAGALPPGNAVAGRSSQIPEFGGTDDESVTVWVRRVDKVALVHGASDGVTLLAASSKLIKCAKKWYEAQTGQMIESWFALRRDLLKMFDRRIPFYKAIQKVEARKWYPQKESFDQYAIEMIALINRLDLPVRDVIHLLVNGITATSIRAIALSITEDSVDGFLERMRLITEGCTDGDRRTASMPEKTKPRISACRNCGKLGHGHKDCRGAPTCFYCKAKGHRQFDCPVLRNRKSGTQGTLPQPQAARVAATVSEESVMGDQVASVAEDVDSKLEMSGPLMTISKINSIQCQLSALMDTGSPVSFIKYEMFEKLIKTRENDFRVVSKRLTNLSREPLNIIGIVKVDLQIEQLRGRKLRVDLHVLKEAFEGDIILGRDFLEDHRLTLVYKPQASAEAGKGGSVNLWDHLPLCIAENPKDELRQILIEAEVDYGYGAKNKLLNIVLEIENREIEFVDDNYEVRVRLKDDSVYAYAPRRFAYAERLQIREIVDDLLKRQIIQKSVSPYCARVIPVRKRDGQLRLCVDLRPLNSRVEKQKYTFPIIEDCLSRLSKKSVFSLLDLKDGFHQIKVHADSTRYFSFATPDGQYEFKRLPFGYSEAPAEFQKRIIQILEPLIRADKILVYIDDIFIPSHTVESNLNVLKEVLLILKTYRFELNYKKCHFLRKEIEFLGYHISANGITLSSRHISAIEKFRMPSNVRETQRFLGLVGYFRRFIKDFSAKAKPLNNLLKKDAKFNFDLGCIEAFELLKKELTSSPVLALYDPTAETELHTDASAVGLGAILLQKQQNGGWGAVAFFSQATNNAEKNYHSFELEMLAIVRAIERFHIYLFGVFFTIVTDCNALVYAVTKANLNPRIARWTLALQNYHFKVTHRPGSKMAHVDALSRVASYVSELPLERELEFRQLSDVHLRKISKELELSENENYTLVNGLVYRKVGNHDLKFVIPESMESNIIRAYHDDMAHCGYEKTVQGVIQNYWFPSVRRKVQEYIKNCLTCIMSNEAPNRLEGETCLYPSPTSPLDIWHIDHFGPLPVTKDNFKHVLVIVDAFTRFTWLRPTKSTTTREVLEIILDLIATFGKPLEIVSDRGTAFTSDEFAKFMSDLSIKHRLVAVAAPWANGMVERINRFIKSSLVKSMNQADEWKATLGKVQYVINNTYHAVIKASPAKLLFGFDQTNHTDSDLARFVKALVNIDADLQTERESAHEKARNATELIRAYNKKYRDANYNKVTKYKEGDYVLIRKTRVKSGESGKLKTNYIGPYLIKKILGNNRYVITDIPGFNITQKPLDTILSSDRIKPWIQSGAEASD